MLVSRQFDDAARMNALVLYMFPCVDIISKTCSHSRNYFDKTPKTRRVFAMLLTVGSFIAIAQWLSMKA